MITPVPDTAFEWRDTPWGAALVCVPLERIARHLFTTRAWALGLARDAGPGAWGDVAAAFERPHDSLVRLKQVHGHDAVVADAVLPRITPAADIVVGRDPSRVLAVQAADCVPLLIADARSGAVAAAHAGWRGMAQGVPALAVRQLQERFGSEPTDMVAACGPSIGACCYEVGEEVRDAFVAAGFPGASLDQWFTRRAAAWSSNPAMPGVGITGRAGHWFFDGWQCVRDQVTIAGVPASSVFVASVCTASHPQAFCSYRRDGALAGRIAGAIVPARRE